MTEPNSLKTTVAIMIFVSLSSMGASAQVTDTTVSRITEAYYAAEYDGRTTAYGETYVAGELTAAHASLPFNSLMRLKNNMNGKSVVVRINDIIPQQARHGLVISYAAADSLGILEKGVASLLFMVLESGNTESEQDSGANLKRFHTIQIGAFKNRANAERLEDRQTGAWSEVIESPDGTVFRVNYGRFSSEEEATGELEKLKENGITGVVKTVRRSSE